MILEMLLQFQRDPDHERGRPEIPPEPAHFQSEQPAQNHHYKNRIEQRARIPGAKDFAAQNQDKDGKHGGRLAVGWIHFRFKLMDYDKISEHAEHVPHGLKHEFHRMAGDRAAEKTSRQPADAIQECRAPESGEQNRRRRQTQQIPRAVNPRGRGDQQRRERQRQPPGPVVSQPRPEKQQCDENGIGQNVWPPARETGGAGGNKNRRREQRRQPRLRPSHPRQRAQCHQQHQRDDGNNDQRIGTAILPVVNPFQNRLPAGAWINLKVVPHDEDLLPRFAGDGLGRVPQRVIHRQKTAADDFQRNDDDGEDDNNPDGQRNVAPHVLRKHGGV